MATSSLTFVTTLAKHYILSDSIIPCQHSISTLSRSISKINAYRLTVTLQVLKGTYEVVIKRNVAMVYLMRVRNRVLRNWGTEEWQSELAQTQQNTQPDTGTQDNYINNNDEETMIIISLRSYSTHYTATPFFTIYLHRQI